MSQNATEAKMKAMMLPRFGGVEQFRLEEIDRPAPQRGEVLVRIVGTSVNPVDVKARAGELPQMFPPEMLPLLLGFDASGRIEALGAGVTDWKIGDAVYGFPGADAGTDASYSRGTFAEYVCLRADEIAAAPQSLPLAEAGAVPLAAMTAWHGLMTQGEMKSGQSVLIQGGSGGVGHFAVQFAHRLGATVYATASGKNQDFLRELGADVAIDYNTDELREICGTDGLGLRSGGRQSRSSNRGLRLNRTECWCWLRDCRISIWRALRGSVPAFRPGATNPQRFGARGENAGRRSTAPHHFRTLRVGAGRRGTNAIGARRFSGQVAGHRCASIRNAIAIKKTNLTQEKLMKIFVTGASGFVGSALVPQLIERRAQRPWSGALQPIRRGALIGK